MTRLEKKYGTFANYNDLIQKILSRNSRDVSKAIARTAGDSFADERRKVLHEPKAMGEKALVMPHPDEVVNRAQSILKAKDRGRMMSENLRARLTEDLHKILSKPEYTRRRGALAGTLKQQAIDDFRKSITETFEGYTKRDPKIGVPPNIRNIAVTEVRTAVNITRDSYMKQMQEKNPDVVITKVWRHNRGAKKPRPAHLEMNGVQIPYTQDFKYYNPDTGNMISTPHPHAPGMPPSESIGCSCECAYKVERYKPHESPYQHEGD